jgi:calcineurin-like phosphoesterase family protein
MKPKLDHYLLSDLHLGHKNILQYCRPWFASIEEHDAKIIESINNTCKPSDTLWLLGDIAFTKKSLDLLKDVKCQLRLVGGNHDTFSSATYLKYFISLHAVVEFGDDGYSGILTHIPIHPNNVFPRYNYNFHGHLHIHHVDDDRYINVSCEPMNFTPRTIRSLIEERLENAMD